MKNEAKVVFTKIFAFFLLLPLLISCAAPKSSNNSPMTIPEKTMMELQSEDGSKSAAIYAIDGLGAGIYSRDESGNITASLDDKGPKLIIKSGQYGIGAFFAETQTPIFSLSENSSPKATLYISPNGSGGFSLFSERSGGGARAEITLSFQEGEGGPEPMIQMKSAVNGTVFRAFCDVDGLPVVELLNSVGESRVVLGVDEKGAGFIKVFDENGVARKI